MDVNHISVFVSICGVNYADDTWYINDVGWLFIYHFAINNNELSWFFWIAMATLTIITLVSDYVLGSRFVKKFGGSKAGSLRQQSGLYSVASSSHHSVLS